MKLTAEGDASSISSATVNNFEGLFDPATGKANKKYDGKNVSLAVAYADTNLKTQAVLGSGASITSTGGNVNVAAKGTAESAANSSTISYIQGLAGVNLSLNLDNSDIDTRIDGAITAAGGVGSGKGSFDADSKVDAAADTIEMKGHDFVTGEQVVYKAAGDFGSIQGVIKPLGGLEDGETYTVIVVDKDHIQLAKTPAIALDASNTLDGSVHRLIRPEAVDMTFRGVDPDTDLILLGDDVFKPGDYVRYRNIQGNAIGGLQDFGVYRVKEVTSEGFTLAVNDKVVNVTLSGAGKHGFIRQSDNKVVLLNVAAVDAGADTIRLYDHGLTDGQIVNYAPGGDEAIGGLEAAAEYQVQRIDQNNFRLLKVVRDQATPETFTVGGPVDLTGDGGAFNHSLVWQGAATTFDPKTAVDATNRTIAISNHGFKTGDVFIYATDDRVNRTVDMEKLDSNGNVVRTTAEAGDIPIAGLTAGQSYSVVVVDANHIRLVGLDVDAKDALPIDISKGRGSAHTLTNQDETRGIGITSKLEASDKAASKPNIGKTLSKITYKAETNPAVNDISPLFLLIKQKGDKKIDSKVNKATKNAKNNDISIAGALSLTIANHSATTRVGVTARNALSSGADIKIDSELEEKYATSAIANVSAKSDDDGNTRTAIAAALSFVDARAVTTVGDGVSLDAGGDIAVTSKVTFPRLLNPTDLINLDALRSGEISGLQGLRSDLLGGTRLFNTFVTTQAKGEINKDVRVIAGSFGFADVQSRADTLIGSDVAVNQKRQANGETFGKVMFDAVTDLTLMSIAGQLKFASGDSVLERLQDRSKSKASILTDGTLVNSGGSDGSGAGASVVIDIVENTARTIVGASTRIAGKDVAVSADEDLFRLGISAAGAKNSDGGTFGLAGSGQGLDYTSSVLALVLPGSTLSPTTITADSVSIAANSHILNITIAGSLTQGSGGTSIGVSAAVNLFDRLVLAGIGAMPLDRIAPPPLSGDARDRVVVRAGSVAVNAKSDGGTWSFAVAGTVSTPPSEGVKTRSNPFPHVNMQQQFANGGSNINPNFQDGAGIGISGAAGWNELNGQTLALIDAGTITAQSILVKALDDTDLIAVTGAASLNLRATSEGASKTMAGVLSIADSTAVTRARVSNAALKADQFGVFAERSGTFLTVSIGVSADLSAQATTLGAAISFNRSTDTTEALLQDIQLTRLSALPVGGAVTVDAKNSTEVIALGGGASFSGKTGLGGAVSVNMMDNGTRASVIRSDLTARGDVSVNALQDNALRTATVSAGVGGSSGGVAAAFLVSVNLVGSQQAGAATSALILDSTVNTAGAVRVAARDDSVLQSVGGALALNLSGSGFGAALGWNSVTETVSATIRTSTVTGASVAVSARATEQDGLLDGRISSAAIGAAAGRGVAVGLSVAANELSVSSNAVADRSTITATAGDIAVSAADTSSIKSLTGAAALSAGGAAVGAALAVNLLGGGATATVTGGSLVASGRSSVTADLSGSITGITIGGALSGGSAAVAGSISVNQLNGAARALVLSGATVDGGLGVSVAATDRSRAITIGGAIAAGNVGVGVGVSTVLTQRTVEARTEAGTTLHSANGAIQVSADASQALVVTAVGGAAGSNVGVAATASVTTLNDTILAAMDGKATADRGDVAVAANARTDLIGVAGALAGGQVGVGVGTDVGILSRSVEARIGQGAEVSALGNISVTADGKLDVISANGAGAGGSVAVVVNVGVNLVNLQTRAVVSEDADLRAGGSIAVTATNDTGIVQVAGNVAGGTVSVGAAAGISKINVTTKALVSARADLTAAGNGAVNAVSGLVDSSKRAVANQGGTVTTGTADVSGNTFTVPAIDGKAQVMDFATGQEVVYLATGQALGGLVSGQRYFVIKTGANQFRLAASREDADAGRALGIDTSTVSPDARHTFSALNGAADMPIGSALQGTNNGKTDSDIADRGRGANAEANGQTRKVIGRAVQNGIVVRALSANDMIGVGGSAGGGGVSVTAAGSVLLHRIDTVARVADGANLAAAGSIAIDAERDYHAITVGGGIAVAGIVAVAPAFTAPVLSGQTIAEAFGNGSLLAGGSVGVTAHANTDLVSVAAGIGVGNSAAVAASVAVVDVKTETRASVEGSRTIAGMGNNALDALLVEATDTTGVILASGSLAVAPSLIGVVAGAGAVSVALIDKTTTATIDGASITTPGAVTVNATSEEDLVLLAASGAAALGATLAGSVGVTIIDSDTFAAVRGSTVNAGALSIVAKGDTDVFTVIAGLAIGGTAGLGASVDFGRITGTTEALLAGGTATLTGALSVRADGRTHIDSNPFAAGGALGVGLGGGISIWSVGDGLSSSYGKQEGNSNYSQNALSGGGGGTVDGQVADILSGLDGSMNSGGGDAGNSGVDLRDQAYQRAGTAGSTVKGANRGTVTGSRLSALTATEAATGAFASITDRAVVQAGGVVLRASQLVDVDQRAGGFGFGFGYGLGAGIAILTTNSDTAVTIGDSVKLTGTGVTGSSLLDVDAISTTRLRTLGIAGAVAGFVALGGSVAKVSTDNDASVSVGSSANIRDFYGASLRSSVTTDVQVSTIAVAAAIYGGIGASIVDVDVTSDATVTISDAAFLRTGAGGIEVRADSNIDVTPLGSLTLVGLGIGGLGIAGAFADVNVAANTVVVIGPTARLSSDGTVSAKALADTIVTLIGRASAFGIVGAGASIVGGRISGTTSVEVGAQAIIDAARIDLLAESSGGITVEAEPLTGKVTAAGIVGIAVVTARASVDRRTGVTVRGALRASGAGAGSAPAISAVATTGLNANAKAAAGAYGLVGVSGSEAYAYNTQSADVTVASMPCRAIRCGPSLCGRTRAISSSVRAA